MLRITIIEGVETRTVVKLEGRLVGPWIAEFGRACAQVLASRVSPNLDLADVFYVDEAGLVALREILRRGATINRCSPFVAEQLRGGLS